MVRFFTVVLVAALLAGCIPGVNLGSDTPVVETQFGLMAVALMDSDPPPPSPYNPPILSAVVQPANPLIAFEACEEFLDQPFKRVCAADWSRSVITPEELESVSVTIMTGGEPTRFRIIFAGHIPGEIAEGVAMSREYVAPPYWSGELQFEVPIYDPFTRVFFLQIEWRSDGIWSPTMQPILFAPCPPDYPWLEEDEGYCESVAR